MKVRVKSLSDEDLYEYLYQSGVKESEIPKRRKDRVTLARTKRG